MLDVWEIVFEFPEIVTYCVLAQYPPWARASSFTRFLDHTQSLSVGLLWTGDQLAAEICSWQHTTLTTNIHWWDWTYNLSRRAVADLRLRSRLHWSQNRHNTTVWTDSRFGSRHQKHYCLCERLHWRARQSGETTFQSYRFQCSRSHKQ